MVSTHSPYFVDLKALAKGGHLVRVSTGSNGTVINEISTDAKNSIVQLSEGNLYNPHVFGLDARELFFQEDQIILTEGQEDVLLLPRVAAQIEAEITGNFFGWGAGGAGNIRHLCQILKDLGYNKVAAILDGDKIEERNKLAIEFPEFFFECIPTKDIRTKPARKAMNEIQGLLDTELELNHEFAELLKVLFGSLSKHMNS